MPRIRMHGTHLLALLAAATLVLAACDSGYDEGRGATATPAAYTLEAATRPGPWAVGATTLTVTDTSRPTQANGGFPASPERAMTVHVWYPATPADAEGRDAPLDAGAARYPLLIFAHAFASLPVFTSSFLEHMASHGYVVAAPEFPLTRLGAPGGPRFIDILNQPGDVSFVVDEMIRMSQDPRGLLTGAIDSDRIGIAGHSGGAYTANLALYGPDRDGRIDAALVIAGDRCFVGSEAAVAENAAVMFMAGSEDLLVDAAASRRAYDAASPPRYRVELRGGNHIRFTDVDLDDTSQADRVRSSVGSQLATDLSALPDGAAWQACRAEPRPAGDPPITLARQQELLRAFATPFFDVYLRGSEGACRFLHDRLPDATRDAARYEFDPE
jgi:predicted dienelactone hydrolase